MFNGLFTIHNSQRCIFKVLSCAIFWLIGYTQCRQVHTVKIFSGEIQVVFFQTIVSPVLWALFLLYCKIVRSSDILLAFLCLKFFNQLDCKVQKSNEDYFACQFIWLGFYTQCTQVYTVKILSGYISMALFIFIPK